MKKRTRRGMLLFSVSAAILALGLAFLYRPQPMTTLVKGFEQITDFGVIRQDARGDSQVVTLWQEQGKVQELLQLLEKSRVRMVGFGFKGSLPLRGETIYVMSFYNREHDPLEPGTSLLNDELFFFDATGCLHKGLVRYRLLGEKPLEIAEFLENCFV